MRKIAYISRFALASVAFMLIHTSLYAQQFNVLNYAGQINVNGQQKPGFTLQQVGCSTTFIAYCMVGAANGGTTGITYTWDGSQFNPPNYPNEQILGLWEPIPPCNCSPTANGGNISSVANEVCTSTNNFPAGFFTLSGYTGVIVNWEWSTNNVNWNNWGNISPNNPNSPPGSMNSPSTFYVRVRVSDGCVVYSSTKSVTVVPNSVGGNINATANSVCASTSNFPAGFFTLSGHTGSVVHWEWSTNNVNWNNWGRRRKYQQPCWLH